MDTTRKSGTNASDTRATSRRGFFKKVAGATALTTAAVAPGCDAVFDLDDKGDKVELGNGDIGVLNYAYALEQLEAAFYTTVVDNFFSGATDEQMQVLTALRDHEIIHREFYEEALGGDAIPDLEVDFSAIDFDSSQSVLDHARIFEDLGVAAYNGAGQLLENANFLLTAGKIVSVEARHAAAIRDLQMPMSAYFAGDDVVDPNTGLDRAFKPTFVLEQASSFIETRITARGLEDMEQGGTYSNTGM